MTLDKTPVPQTECRKFYLCALNKLNMLSCPIGLLFDTKLKRCNYANGVICKSDATTNIMTTTSSESK
jgi:hypothetical protein